ncbi:hypothetical protein [Loktanella sp. M215]|uniref:hypothetical protein n=1 Tax=Loktanella sp. M215 TaxID=2675431 RepID=UPI001F3659FF|nr:hypothetical protein [Loktanella sp. M215]MCF7701606.1 hypothetical protein [Loktanella sp. M215]
MIVPTKIYVIPKAEPRPETTMEKTTRVVREELDAAAEKRLTKALELRAARLAKEADVVAGVGSSQGKAGSGTAKTKDKF